MQIVGHAAVFDSWSVDLGGFKERIRAGAFRNSLRSNLPVFALHHHNFRDVIASTQAKSMKLSEDKRGLHFEIQLPDTSLGRDLHALVTRGDIRNMSFAFAVRGSDGELWTDPGGGRLLERELLDLDLFEVSTVARPAYLSTSVSARSAAQAVARRKDILERTLRLQLATSRG